MKWKSLTGVTMLSYGSVNMKLPCVRRSMKIRLILAVPMLPSVLYCPYRPSLNVEFIYRCCSVSTGASVLSPNLSSMVHTLIPFGISLSEPSESVFARLLVCGLNCESSLLLKSFCAATVRVAAQNSIIVNIDFFIIFLNVRNWL